MNVRPDRTKIHTKSGLISGKTNAIKEKQLFKYKKEKQLILQQYLR
jgi:hypothetical protein